MTMKIWINVSVLLIVLIDGEDSSIKINYNSEFYEGFAPCFQLSDNYKEVSSKKISEEY